ncbi:MAG: DUF418 domain-containing protein [Nonomuraea sp.]|nr:DUF418 domain-containing protein [Nonomuraea sp.]
MRRIRELDALRGFAVCGIMLVNTWQHAPHGPHSGLDWTIETLFQSRFYPIFSTLFGISFVLFLANANRWALLSRLFWLLCFGLVQHTFYDGEVLTDYAVYGAAVLLPASFLTGGVPVLLLGLAVLAWSVTQGGGPLEIPGLFLIGMALMRLRPPATLLAPVAAVAALGSAVLTVFWLDSRVWAYYSVAALAGAASYACLFLLAKPLHRWVEPLGRMALTNYVTGTAVIALAGPWVLPVTLGTLAVQIPFSRWWLARYRYGPLEWVWRCLTWFRVVPNRLGSGRDDNRPLPDPGVT